MTSIVVKKVEKEKRVLYSYSQLWVWIYFKTNDKDDRGKCVGHTPLKECSASRASKVVTVRLGLAWLLGYKFWVT